MKKYGILRNMIKHLRCLQNHSNSAQTLRFTKLIFRNLGETVGWYAEIDPPPWVNRRNKYRSGSLLLTRGKASDEMALWSGPHEHADQTHFWYCGQKKLVCLDRFTHRITCVKDPQTLRGSFSAVSESESEVVRFSKRKKT